MTTMNDTTLHKTSHRSGGLIAGGILIALGVVTLAENVFNLEAAILPLLAAIFLAAGLLSKKTGLIVPGSILAGVSLGFYLTGAGFHQRVEIEQGGLFFLALAAGFGLISLLSLYTRGDGRMSLWPLWPAAFLALFGAALLSGSFGLLVLNAMTYAWPVILILIGGSLIFKQIYRK